MKALGNISKILLDRALDSVSYDVIRWVASQYGLYLFSEETKECLQPKDTIISHMFSGMFSNSLIGHDTEVVILDIGIDEFCNQWIEFIDKNNDGIRKQATGELDMLNLKMNCVINTLIKKEELDG